MTQAVPPISSPVGVIAGGGTLPFAVADSIKSQGLEAVLFALKGFCDPDRVTNYRYHWISIGQYGALTRKLRDEKCRDLVFIGSLVRPALSEVKLDWGTLRILPSIIRSLRGGDDHLLTAGARIFEDSGFRLHGIKDVAPGLLLPAGQLTGRGPSEEAFADIQKGRAVLAALSPFDVGQAVVVIDGHVVAIEDIEGTDGLLTRVAALRAQGRLRAKPGRGVLVKLPKTRQDLRFDLPALGPKTVEGVAAAGLAGVAALAESTLAAELQVMIEAADQKGLFLTGLPS